MSRAIGVLQDFPGTKKGITMMAEAIVNGVMEGNVDPLDIRIKLDAIERVIKAVKSDVAFKDATMDQADLEAEKTFDFKGAKITKGVSTKYDYSDDSLWSDLKKQEDKWAVQRKERETLLKTLSEPTEINGQMAAPPVKYSVDVLKVSL